MHTGSKDVRIYLEIIFHGYQEMVMDSALICAMLCIFEELVSHLAQIRIKKSKRVYSPVVMAKQTALYKGKKLIQKP